MKNDYRRTPLCCHKLNETSPLVASHQNNLSFIWRTAILLPSKMFPSMPDVAFAQAVLECMRMDNQFIQSISSLLISYNEINRPEQTLDTKWEKDGKAIGKKAESASDTINT